jgi:carbonic anhydrase
MSGMAAVTFAGQRVSAQRPDTPPASPAEALQRLVDGNRRFAADQITSIEHDLQLLKQHTVDKQEPFAAVLSCAEIIGSLEYGAIVLGVKVLLVMGHANCGAVKAAIAKTPVPGQIASLYPHLQQAVEQGGGSLEATIKKNALIQASLLAKTSTVLAPLIANGNLKIQAAYYNVENGKVSLL